LTYSGKRSLFITSRRFDQTLSGPYQVLTVINNIKDIKDVQQKLKIKKSNITQTL